MISDKSQELSQTGVRKLIVFQKATELIRLVYKISLRFPRYELYGITSQIRRAAVSIALNIAEGYVRNSRKDFARFLDMALGSCAELDVIFEIALDLGYLTQGQYNALERLRVEIGKLLYSFRRSLSS